MSFLDEHATHVQMSVAFMKDENGNPFARVLYHYVDKPDMDWSLDHTEDTSTYQNLFEYFDGKDSRIMGDDFFEKD